MAVAKTITQAEGSTVFISRTLHSLALRWGRRMAIPRTGRQLAPVATLRPQLASCLGVLIGGSLTLVVLLWRFRKFLTLRRLN